MSTETQTQAIASRLWKGRKLMHRTLRTRDVSISAEDERRPKRRILARCLQKMQVKVFGGGLSRTQSFRRVSREEEEGSAESGTQAACPILPVELQVRIVSALDFRDVLAVRKSSRALHGLITTNQGQIVRVLVQREVPRHMVALYPLPTVADDHLGYLAGLKHRHMVCRRISQHLWEFILREVMSITDLMSLTLDRPEYPDIRWRMHAPLATLFHYLEHYRAARVQQLTIWARSAQDPGRTPLDTYCEELLDAYGHYGARDALQMYEFLRWAFRRSLAPPPRRGKLGCLARCLSFGRERSKHKALVAAQAKVFIVGGLREVERIWSVEGHAARRRTVNLWLDGLRPCGSEGGARARGFRWRSAPPPTVAGGDPGDPPPGDYPMPPLAPAEVERLVQHSIPPWYMWEIHLAPAPVLRRMGAPRLARRVRPVRRYINVLVGVEEDDMPTGIGTADSDLDSESTNGWDDDMTTDE
ncbi:MAG: hypothetical protein M1832_003109 [Thelocarpon impressellum]|nr:MAG: hypothetical protein M1832_003109 [Thelocarpon impressellum]